MLEMNSYKVNENAACEGVWFQASGAEFKLKYMGTTALNSRLVNLLETECPEVLELKKNRTKAVKSCSQSGESDLIKSLEINLNFFIDNGLLDWKDVSQGGEIVEFSKEAAYELLSNHKKLAETLMEVANNPTYFSSENIKKK